jgi:Fur family ferric uptake transcriptional regulator
MATRADYRTHARKRIEAILAHEPRFLSAAEIHDQLKHGGALVALSTVYRTLDRLHERGEVTARPDAEGEATYMACEPARHHHHAICEECGRVEDVDCSTMEPFAESLRTLHGFELDRHAMEFFGRCRACR